MGLSSLLSDFLGTRSFKVRERRPSPHLVSAAESLESRALLSATATTVWNDVNGNGIFDAPEPKLTGIEVKLWSAGGDAAIGGGDDVLVGTKPTNSSGFSGFDSLPPGAYFYQYILPAGKSVTLRDQGTNEALDSDAGIDNRSRVFTLGNDTKEFLVDVGVVDKSVAATAIFNDANANGIFDGGETLVNGVMVELHFAGADGAIGGGDDVLIESKTSSAGFAGFDNLTSGEYYFKYVRPMGQAFTTRDAGVSEFHDSDVGQDGLSNVFMIAPASGQFSIDAGLTKAGRTATATWQDTTKDGIFDSTTEPFARNINVSLFSAGADGLIGGGDDVLIGTKLTTPGFAGFDNLTFGSYYFSYALPADLFFTLDNQGTNDALDSDIGLSGQSLVFQLTPAASAEFLIDLGVIDLPPSGAATTVWNDANNNGIFDGGETTVNGVTVRLFRTGADGQAGGGDDVLVETKVTTGGAAGFTNLNPSTNYFFEYDTPAGKAVTLRDQGTNEALDSDVGVDKRSSVFQLQTGATQFLIDLGLATGGGTATTVWDDVNGNGIFESGEQLVSGITTQLFEAGADGQAGGGDDLLIETKATKDGFAGFDDLAAGNYFFRYTPPAGKSFTVQGQGGNEALDSDSNITGTSEVFALAPGGKQFLVDVGLAPSAGSATTFVWDDTQPTPGVADGLFLFGEFGRVGVAVQLFHAGFDGQASGGDDVMVGSAVTGSGANAGLATFSNLGVGTYFFVYTIPTGTSVTFKDVGADDTIDSDVLPLGPSGRSNVFFLGIGDSENTVDLGLTTP